MRYAVEVNHLKKHFGSLEAVKDLSFRVEEGELFGFLGINGAGKSTTINMLATLMPPTNGLVNVAGFDLNRESKMIRQSIGVVFQCNTLDDKLTIKENLRTRAYLYEHDPKKINEQISYVTKMLEIEELLERRFKDLSGGQKRKCEIARALLNRPRILFLDEPTTGLDPQTRKLVWEEIEKIQKETNMTIFLTTHYMEEAVRAKHIAIMDAGEMVAYDTPYVLKEKYATDLLKIVSSDKEALTKFLKEKRLEYQEIDHRIHIQMENTIAAIPLLQQLKSYITAFEVVQGTLEDAFLNVTGRTIEEVK